MNPGWPGRSPRTRPVRAPYPANVPARRSTYRPALLSGSGGHFIFSRWLPGLNGDYSFYATEYLYTNGVPSGLEADLIDFLMSRAVAAQLRDTSFISCPDLSRSKLTGACSAG